MTPEQALNVLDQVTQQVSANRATHQQIAEALRVLAQLVNGATHAKTPLKPA